MGRGEFLRSLGSAVDKAAGGTPTAVVVSGEVGVGKTRLVRELLLRDDIVVFAGSCLPVVGEPLPYAALTQALRSSSPHLLAREVARAPELARLLPAAPSGSGSSDDDVTDVGEGSRLRLFQSVLGLLGRIGGPHPVVHVVEDLHWADRSTLDLLSFLAANLERERVLLLLTYRSDAVGPGDPLLGWLAELGRLMPLERLDLDRLTPEDTAALIGDLLGSGPDPEVLEAVVARSAGNPLIAEQLALAGGADTALPATVHDLLLSRVAGLPQDTRALLGAVAVLGRVSSVPLLARTLEQDPTGVEDALRPALAANVAELTRDGRVDVHHPAYREVVYAELMPGERLRLHTAAAAALEADVARTPAVSGEMARHWYAAGDLARALEASVAAGRTYDRLFAPSDAYAAYARALELAEQDGATVPVGLDLVDLRVRASDAAGMTGDNEAAVRLLEEARLIAAGAARARVCERLGTIHRQAGDGEASEARLREALALLPADEVSVLTARVHAGIALLGIGWSRLDQAETAGRRALEIARAVGARSEEGRALNACGSGAAMRGDYDDGIAMLREALALAREEQHPYDLGVAYINLSHVLGLAGRLDELVELGRIGIVELSRVGQGRQRGSLLLANVAEVLSEAGRYDEAAELVADALARHPRGIIAAPVLRESARIATVRGDLTAAWEWCEQARVAVESASSPVSWVRAVAETAVEVELWAGRPDAAYELVVDTLDQVAGTDDETNAGVLVALGLRALADDATVRRDHRSRSLRGPRRTRLLVVRDRVDPRAADTALPEHAGRVDLGRRRAGPTGPRSGRRRLGRLGRGVGGAGPAVPDGVRPVAAGGGGAGRGSLRGVAPGAAHRARLGPGAGRGRADRGAGAARPLVPRRSVAAPRPRLPRRSLPWRRTASPRVSSRCSTPSRPATPTGRSPTSCSSA